MANQLKMAKIQAILSLHAQGWTQIRIAETLQVDRETVRKYVRQQSCGPKPANCADRLGGLKTARFAECPGWGIKTSKRADRLTG